MARRLTFDDPADVVPTPTRASLPSVGTYRPSTLLANGVGLQSVKLFVGSVALVAVLYVIIKSVFRWLATLKRKRAVELKVDPPPEWVGPGCQLEGFFVGTTVSVTAICEGHTNEEAIILSRFESKLNDARGEDGYVALERVGVTRDRMTWTSQPLKELGKYRIQYICQKPNAKKIEIITSVSFTVTAPRLELAQTVALWKDSVNVRITASPSHPSSDTIVLLPHSGGEDRIEELQQRYVGRDLSSLEVAAVSSVKVPSVAGGEPVDVALPGSTRQGYVQYNRTAALDLGPESCLQAVRCCVFERDFQAAVGLFQRVDGCWPHVASHEAAGSRGIGVTVLERVSCDLGGSEPVACG